MYKSGWSFCIVTAPNNEKVLSQCIDSIVHEFNSNYEIIVIGASKLSTDPMYQSVKFVHFQEDIFSPGLRNLRPALKHRSLKKLFYKSGAISHKKNLAASMAVYDKLCIMHDYVALVPGWLNAYNSAKGSWDVCMNMVLDIEGRRHRDWMTWDFPGIGPGLLPYHAYTQYMYISGTYFCVKNQFYRENQLSEKLFWGEGEDVEWSLRVRNKTKFVFIKGACVRYLKTKPPGDCPNCPSWQVNTKKLEAIFSSGANEV